jgi:hypothetical protein
MKGDIAGSFQMYPPLLPVILCAILAVTHLVNKKAVPASRLKYISVIVLAIVMINYAAKMLSTAS